MHLLKRNHIKNINQQPALHAIEQKKKRLRRLIVLFLRSEDVLRTCGWVCVYASMWMFAVSPFFFCVWLKGGTVETPSWILHPVIFPSSARALSGEGGAVTSLPRTTAAAEGGHLLTTEVSAKEWLRPYKPPPGPTPPYQPSTIKVFAPLQPLNRLQLIRPRWGTLHLLLFTHTR